MARIAGVDLPKEKKIEIALTYIYGIGRKLSQIILNHTNINHDLKVKDLSETDISKLNTYIAQNYKVEGELRREVQENIRRLIEINCYRGYRHRRKLPVRGQRTRTNARTRRGKRKTIGSAKPGARLQPQKLEK